MSASEFGVWMVYMSHEGLLPANERFRHGQAVAAMYNAGDLRPSGARRNWEAGDFFDPDVWTPPEEEPPASIAEQVEFLNRWQQ